MASEILLQIELDSESDNEEPKSEKVEVLFQGVRLAEGELFWALNGTKLWPCIIVRNEIDKFLERRNGKLFINVIFINDYRSASLGEKKIVPFKGKAKISASELKYRVNDCPKASRALDIADFLLKLKKRDRISLFKKLSNIDLSQKILKYKKSKNKIFRNKRNKLLTKLIKYLIQIEKIQFVQGLVKKEPTTINERRNLVALKRSKQNRPVKNESAKSVESVLETDANQISSLINSEEPQLASEFPVAASEMENLEPEILGPPCKRPKPNDKVDSTKKLTDSSARQYESTQLLNDQKTFPEAYQNIHPISDPEASRDSGLELIVQSKSNSEIELSFTLDLEKDAAAANLIFEVPDISLDSGFSVASELSRDEPNNVSNCSQCIESPSSTGSLAVSTKSYVEVEPENDKMSDEGYEIRESNTNGKIDTYFSGLDIEEHMNSSEICDYSDKIEYNNTIIKIYQFDDKCNKCDVICNENCLKNSPIKLNEIEFVIETCTNNNIKPKDHTKKDEKDTDQKDQEFIGCHECSCENVDENHKINCKLNKNEKELCKFDNKCNQREIHNQHSNDHPNNSQIYNESCQNNNEISEKNHRKKSPQDKKNRPKIQKPLAKYDIDSLIDPANILDEHLDNSRSVRMTRRSIQKLDVELKEGSVKTPQNSTEKSKSPLENIHHPFESSNHSELENSRKNNQSSEVKVTVDLSKRSNRELRNTNKNCQEKAKPPIEQPPIQKISNKMIENQLETLEKGGNQVEEIVQEETVEDLYVAINDDELYLYKNATDNHICNLCYKFKNTLHKCQGSCERWYHDSCGEMRTLKSNKSGPEKVLCKTCFSEDFHCHVCKKGASENPESLVLCQYGSCGLYYHQSCLQNWPENPKGKKKFNCPQHFCHSCNSRTVRGDEEVIKDTLLVKCVLCPTAYHQNCNCTPAGSKILSEKFLICPRHPTSKKKIFSKAQKKIAWCFYCHKSDGEMKKCVDCPVAYHQSCVPNYFKAGSINSNRNICPECASGKLPLYNEVVWGNYLNYRWWPCIIFPTEVLYESVLKDKVFSSSFAVRFFGTADYGFLTADRVVEFKHESLNIPKMSCGTPDYEKALREADEVQNICKALKLNRQQLFEYSPRKLRVHSTLKPVDDRDEGFVCSCVESDESPCGESCWNRAIMHECFENLCNAGSKCQNQRFQKQQYCKVKVIETKLIGKGLLADQDIKKGTFIIEYTGEFIDKEEMVERMKKKKKDDHFYILYVDVNRYVDAEFKGNHSKYINHSCNPNCMTQKWTVCGKSRMGIFAKDDIKAGTELSFHYKFDNFGQDKMRCLCKSENCTGYMNTGKSKPSESSLEPINGDFVVYGKNGKPKLKRGNGFVFRRMTQDLSKPNAIHENDNVSGEFIEPNKFRVTRQRVELDRLGNRN